MTRFLSRSLFDLLERDLLPDTAIRFGIRRLLAQRLRSERASDPRAVAARKRRLVEQLGASPIAIHTDDANAQHYEVPATFYERVLGRHLKYSSAYWPAGVETLDEAERRMLELSARRAHLEDGQDVLELGCGWGSMTLYMAERYPASRILGVSNSASQRSFILERAAVRGLGNVEILTHDVNRLELDRRFDRVVSIEMFEHVRNYQRLFSRVASWMRPEAELFVHVFCHRHLAYPFEDRGDGDWMARHFFTGGLMPSADLFEHFREAVEIEESWLVPGVHYARTSEAWLANMDLHREQLWPILERTYGAHQARRFWVYWRVFFMACAELFAYRHGQEWMVAHQRFRRREPTARAA
ncbi:MAG: cyclopropane-fatty-acyl-phospholipid synthase family protein [Holophagales bacterium]|nr:cyclopropane-fatty-acyl-phospholipid synthase family protein [Holophagales bacterium]